MTSPCARMEQLWVLVPLRNVGRWPAGMRFGDSGKGGQGVPPRHQNVVFFFPFLNEELPKNTMFFLGFNQLKGGGLGPVFLLFWVCPQNIRWEKRKRLSGSTGFAALVWRLGLWGGCHQSHGLFEFCEFTWPFWGWWVHVTSFSCWVEVMVLLSMHVSGQRSEVIQIHGEFERSQSLSPILFKSTKCLKGLIYK